MDIEYKVGLLLTLGGIHRFVPCGAAVAADATAVGDEFCGGLSSLGKRSMASHQHKVNLLKIIGKEFPDLL